MSQTGIKKSKVQELIADSQTGKTYTVRSTLFQIAPNNRPTHVSVGTTLVTSIAFSTDAKNAFAPTAHPADTRSPRNSRSEVVPHQENMDAVEEKKIEVKSSNCRCPW